MLGLAKLHLEVVLVAEVQTVNPRRINAVTLSILTLMVAQVVVVMDVLHKASLIILRSETELVVSHLVVSRNVERVV